MKVEYSLPPGVPPPKTDGVSSASANTPSTERKGFLARKIGALWVEEDKNKSKYLSGTIRTPDGREERVYVFKNINKAKDNHPDWEIILSESDFELRQKDCAAKGIVL